MAATVHPHPASLRLVAVPAARPTPVRPALRPLDGGRSRQALQRRRVYRRRRLVALLALITVLLVGWQAVVAVAGVFADPAPTVEVVPVAAAPISGPEYVVAPGDNLWSIARRVAPGRDPREVVDELTARLDGAPLHAGTRLDIHGLG